MHASWSTFTITELCNSLQTNGTYNVQSIASYSYASCLLSPHCRRRFGLLRSAADTSPEYQALTLHDLQLAHPVPDWWTQGIVPALQLTAKLPSHKNIDSIVAFYLCPSNTTASLLLTSQDTLRTILWLHLVEQSFEAAQYSIDASLPICETPRLPRCGAGLFLAPTGVGAFECMCHRRVRGSNFVDNAQESCGNRDTDAASSTMLFALVCIIVFQALVLALTLTNKQNL